MGEFFGAILGFGGGILFSFWLLASGFW